jgi:hypothetical protein
MSHKRVKEQMSIVTAVSFGRSSKCVSRIAIAHTVGSMVTLTTLGSITRDGMNFIPNQGLKQMLKTNGLKVTEVTKENGNEL